MVTQTAKIAATTPDGGEPEKTPQSAFTAATEYAEHGWPVLPGSAWNGRRYQIPGTNRITDGVRPTVPRNYATTRESTITEWWGLRGPLVPTIGWSAWPHSRRVRRRVGPASTTCGTPSRSQRCSTRMPPVKTARSG
jgi:hypothetical protein